jgi:hypothetical protein
MRLLRRDRLDALYIVPAMLVPRQVPKACGPELHTLAARIVKNPLVAATGPGACMVETVSVNGGQTGGGHPVVASAACLPLRRLGSYAEFLPRIDDAVGREYALVPDSDPAVTFVFSDRRRRTVAARDNLTELPSPVRFTTGPGLPTLARFANHLAAILPAKIIVGNVTYSEPTGLVIELSRSLLAEDRLLALAGGGGSTTWSL